MKTPDVYDMSNPHFSNCALLLGNGKKIKGSFVRFKIITDDGYEVYPAEKLCFLPDSNRMEFNNHIRKSSGELISYPDYILQIDLSEIVSIVIEPRLII